MAITVRPTAADVGIARAIARRTTPEAERAATVFTWGADEHVLTALAAGWWLWCRGWPREARRASDHLLLTTIAASLLPHLLKTVFDQERPDRLMVRGHLHGVPYSGNKMDAFPSGHAVHVGALASAAAEWPRGPRTAVWVTGTVLAATRIVLLAHWTSDVICGVAIGAALERALRLVTGYGRIVRAEKAWGS
jgi:PAP2 superfamily protein